MLRKIYRKLFPAKGLIINHDSAYDEDLMKLFPHCDIIEYKDFKKENTRKYKYFVLSGGSINISGKEDLVEEKEFIRTTTKPIFGVCLGFQIICIAYGAELKEFTENNNSPVHLDIKLGRLKSAYIEGDIENRHYCYIDEGFFLPTVSGDKLRNKYFKNHTEHRRASTNCDSITNQPVYNTTCVMNGNIFATQGHPEISGEFGKKIRNLFLKYYVH